MLSFLAVGLYLPIAITIHVAQVIRDDMDRFFGIDLNYIRDRDSNRSSARPLDASLVDMGVKWLRFPGGEKSNYHLWSEPPFTKPAPRSLGWYATPTGERMDFDEFIRHSRAVQAEPYVVVGYQAEAKTGLTKAQWLATAVAWVRYAKSKRYNVRYWEIGNENWNKGIAPADMARTVVEFAKAMRGADRSTRIGASGDNDRWWKEFLPIAGPYLDFLSVSQYTGWQWGSYEHFLTNPDLIETARGALGAIDRYAAPEDRRRLRVIVAETNTKDFTKGGWKDSNDLGHALVTFSMLGHLAKESRISAAMVWTTRWMVDSDAPTTEYYALGQSNQLMPTGQALKAWGKFARADMVATVCNDTSVDAFASRSADGRSMVVWLLNRGTEARGVRLNIDGPAYGAIAEDRFSGVATTDRNPRWESVPAPIPRNNAFTDLPLPGLSISILTFSSRTGRFLDTNHGR